MSLPLSQVQNLSMSLTQEEAEALRREYRTQDLNKALTLLLLGAAGLWLLSEVLPDNKPRKSKKAPR